MIDDPSAPPPRLAKSFRELADGVGRSHTVVQRWVQHPAWDQPAHPPWNIEQAIAWAARTLAPNPADAWRRRVSDVGPGVTGAAVYGAAPDSALEALRRQPLTAAKLKLTVVRAAKLELERDILAGEFVRKSEVEQALARRVYAVRAAFEALPRQIASQLAGLREAEIEDVLGRAIAVVLHELSQRSVLPRTSDDEE